jgi:hypothetical protein
MQFTGSSVNFEFASETATYDIGTDVYPPSHYYRVVEPRIYASGTGNCGIMQTQFDDVAIRKCFYDPVSFQYDGLGSPLNIYSGDLQTALDNVSNSNGMIKIQDLFYTRENLVFDHDMSASLYGGFNCDYSSETGFSIIDGSLSLVDGTVTLKNIMIR